MSEEKQARSVVGRVVSDKAEKTVTVLIERRVAHPLYKKFMKRSTKVRAHDENNEGREGDLVRIQEGRPRSRTKTWELTGVVERPD